MQKFSSTMKASSRQTSRNRRSFLVFGLLLLFVVLFYVVPKVPGHISAIVFGPVEHVKGWMATSDSPILRYFRDKEQLVQENIALKQRLEQLTDTERTIDNLNAENDSLRALLGSEDEPRIAASILSRPPLVPYDVFVLDKGSTDGVLKDAPVYSGHDKVIGFVAEAYLNTSVVVLATAPGLESTVYIIGPNIYTTAVGMGGGILRVNVPQGIPLTEGDLVVLPSLDVGIFGTLSSIESVPTQPEQYGYVSGEIPLNGIRYVSVGIPGAPRPHFDEVNRAVTQLTSDLLTLDVPGDMLIDTSGTSTGTSTATVLFEEEGE